MEVALLDYGVGNLYSIASALNRLDAYVRIITRVREGFDADALIMPGVGNFTPVAYKMAGEREDLYQLVKSGKPILGICLGLQILLQGSEEGSGNGLGLISGWVRRLPDGVKIPHIGWNTLIAVSQHEFIDGVQEGSWVYYVHSYYPDPIDESVILTRTEYGLAFPSIIGRGTLVGTQFHPEKSGKVGKMLLQNFLKMAKR